jgi:hypothetical protein
MLERQPKQTGGVAMKLKARVIEKPEVPISLAEAGIDKNLAHCARRAAIENHGRFRRLRSSLSLQEGADAKTERHRKQRWRALRRGFTNPAGYIRVATALLCIKAKLESGEKNARRTQETLKDCATVADLRVPLARWPQAATMARRSSADIHCL